MKKFIIIAMLTAIMPLAAMAQHEEDTENGVVSLAGREGFTIETKKGDFVFKPYLLVQTSANSQLRFFRSLRCTRVHRKGFR